MGRVDGYGVIRTKNLRKIKSPLDGLKLNVEMSDKIYHRGRFLAIQPDVGYPNLFRISLQFGGAYPNSSADTNKLSAQCCHRKGELK